MAVRPCLPWPDKRLRTPAAEIEQITDAHRDTWQDLIDTMEAMPGVGMGANQIGEMVRLAVVDASEKRGQVAEANARSGVIRLRLDPFRSYTAVGRSPNRTEFKQLFMTTTTKLECFRPPLPYRGRVTVYNP